MKRISIYLTAVAMALVPAVVGLWGNATFAQGVSHRISAPAATSTRAGADDGASHAARAGRHHRHHARHQEAGDDKGNHAEPGDDQGNHVEAGDDHAGAHGGHHDAGDDKGSGGHGSDD